ncbi:MAG: LLM class flavin-dependent oxidoreductase [Myxococcota bacterium]
MGNPLGIWTLTVSSPRSIARNAERTEAAGWDGIAVVDSQNLSGDAYVALAIAASKTERIGIATAVTNPVTRHPAVTAAAIAGLQVYSGGRATLGIGRGDSSLAHLGRAPARVSLLERYVAVLQDYLRGEEVPFEKLDFHERMAPSVHDLGLADTPDASRLLWIDDRLPKVQVEVAATGPRVIAAAARTADRVMFALGAEPDRIAWGIQEAREARSKAGLDPGEISFGAYVNCVSHPDVTVARELVSGGLSTFARFAVMHGSVAGPVSQEQRRILESLHRAYDMKHHTRVDSPQAKALPPEFIDRYAVVGPPRDCVARLQELAALGLERVLIIGPTAGADRTQARLADRTFVEEVLPAFAG